MSILSDGATGIQLTTGVFALSYLLLLFKTNITIDGFTTVVPWGRHYFPLATGNHELTVSFRSLVSRKLGASTITVHVVAGAMTPVEYRSPGLPFAKDKLKVLSQ